MPFGLKVALNPEHMKMNIRFFIVPSAILLSALAATSFISCGNDSNTLAPPPASLSPLGSTVSLACQLGGSPAVGASAGTTQGQNSKQQQIPFQRKPECLQQQNNPSSQQQQLTFTDSKVSDFDFSVDCVQRRVFVRSKGRDQETSTLPIASDGSVVGELDFLNQLSNDGKGSGTCWAGYKVTFNGKVDCDAQKPGTSTKNPDYGKVSINAEVAFRQSSSLQLQQSGIASMDSIVPASSNATIETPGTVPSLAPSPSPSASPRPSDIPTPTATVIVTPVRVCIIENPCPIVGKVDLTCPQ